MLTDSWQMCCCYYSSWKVFNYLIPKRKLLFSFAIPHTQIQNWELQPPIPLWQDTYRIALQKCGGKLPSYTRAFTGQHLAPVRNPRPWNHLFMERINFKQTLCEVLVAGIRFSSNTNFEAFIPISPVVWIVCRADRKMSKDTRRKHGEIIYRVLKKEAEKRVFCFILASDCSNTEELK